MKNINLQFENEQKTPSRIRRKEPYLHNAIKHRKPKVKNYSPMQSERQDRFPKRNDNRHIH